MNTNVNMNTPAQHTTTAAAATPAPAKAPALLVLAAGMGSRYGGLKQIDPVGPSGETVLDYSVFDALRSGFKKIVFVIRRDFETQFRETVTRRFEKHAEVVCVFQELDMLPPGRHCPAGREKPWGTGHAVWCARAALQEPFAVINADDFYGADSFNQLAAFLAPAPAPAAKPSLATPSALQPFSPSALSPAPAPAPASCCMVGFNLAATLSEHGAVSRGICTTDSAGHLLAIEECTAIEPLPDGGARQQLPNAPARLFTGRETVSMNCWGFTPSILPFLENELAAFLDRRGAELKSEFYLPEAIARLIATGAATARVLPTTAAWFGVTYREDRPRVIAALRALVEAGAYPQTLQL